MDKKESETEAGCATLAHGATSFTFHGKYNIFRIKYGTFAYAVG